MFLNEFLYFFIIFLCTKEFYNDTEVHQAERID